MQERIDLLEALSEQQVKRLQNIHALQRRIAKLGDQIMALNNATRLRVHCTHGVNHKEEDMLVVQWHDHTAADADTLRQTVRAILQARLDADQEQLRQVVELEESRLTAILKDHGNSELPTSDTPVQN